MCDSNELGARPDGPGSREPSPSVSAASGFDPSRNRCENCQHWRFETPDWQFDELIFGECKAVKMREDIETEALEGTGFDRWDDEAGPLIKAAMLAAKAIAVDGSGYYAGLRTRPDFGCVMHAPRDSDGSPKGGDACGSVEDDSAVPPKSGNRPSPEGTSHAL